MLAQINTTAVNDEKIVVVENVFTTNMSKFLKVAAYRNEIYKNHFPTGSWLGVKELALPEFMIEIELEAHKVEEYQDKPMNYKTKAD